MRSREEIFKEQLQKSLDAVGLEYTFDEVFEKLRPMLFVIYPSMEQAQKEALEEAAKHAKIINASYKEAEPQRLLYVGANCFKIQEESITGIKLD